MALFTELEKVEYVDRETAITAKNLNEIQDAVIELQDTTEMLGNKVAEHHLSIFALEKEKRKLLGKLELNSSNCVCDDSDEIIFIEYNEELVAQAKELLAVCEEASGCLLMTIHIFDFKIKANACYSGKSEIGFAENISAAVMNTDGDGLEFIRIGRSWVECTNSLFRSVLAAGKTLTIEVYET